MTIRNKVGVSVRILDQCCGAGAGLANNVTGSSSETVLCSCVTLIAVIMFKSH